MELRAAIWNLKSPRCDCCAGQGALCFYACPGCGHVVLVCDEVGTVFLRTRHLTERAAGGVEDATCRCPGCKGYPVKTFEPASAEAIQAMGYQPSEYE